MSQPIPENLRHSKAIKFVTERGWNWRAASGDQIQVEECPYCHKKDFKFYMATGDPNDPKSTRDGLHMCHHGSCGKQGNIRTLAEFLGLRIPGVDSRKEWAGGNDKPDELPNVEVCHATLLGDADAMDYLLNVRGFTNEIIERQKLGLKEKVWFREAGESRALVIPYLVGGNVVFAKFRTLPPKPKDFVTPTGWDAPLYNGEILREGIKEVIFVEGETNTICLMNYGVDNVVGVPGANVKKAAWIDLIDKLKPRIFIMYDTDKVGKKNAQEVASRIGIEKCRKLILPLFTVTVPEDQCKLCDEQGITEGRKYDAQGRIANPRECTHTREGKDINEWFRWGGGTLELFEKMKETAGLFDVSGVTSAADALTQLEEELAGKIDMAPSYTFQWPEVSRMLGMEDGDVLDIVAPEKVGKTTFGMNIMDHMVAKYGEDGLIVCLEMTQARLAKKWVALVTGYEDTITESGTIESKAKLDELKACCVTARSIQQSRGADLYFAYPMQWQDDPDSVFKLIKDCIRRYGVRWVMFDNLQKFVDESLKSKDRTLCLSQFSKKFATIAKDYRIKLIRILQPKRIALGQTISTNDVDGSSQVAKDCDAMITLWRAVVGELKKSEWETQKEGFQESAESFEPIMKVTVGLSRYSSGGSTSLFYDGARSQVRSLTDEKKASMKNTSITNASEIIMENGTTVPVIPIESESDPSITI